MVADVMVAGPTALSAKGRFAAFSFVDRITLIDGVRHVTGVYQIPENVSRFPVSLVAEALGQLAAWVAMSTCDFARRPVAALAGDTRIHAYPKAGDTLQLHVDIDSCDRDSITYRGKATVGDTLILELLDTIGSNLGIEIFDAPEALAADFAVLTSAGRQPGLFEGVPAPVMTTTSHQVGERIEALLDVPADADYFNDHFPRRPVFPATLLLDAQLHLARQLLADLPESSVALEVTRITNVKVRAFTSPGTSLAIFAELSKPSSDDPEPFVVKVGATVGARTIAAAKFFFAPESRENT